jgi:hypothetical protein
MVAGQFNASFGCFAVLHPTHHPPRFNRSFSNHVHNSKHLHVSKIVIATCSRAYLVSPRGSRHRDAPEAAANRGAAAPWRVARGNNPMELHWQRQRRRRGHFGCLSAVRDRRRRRRAQPHHRVLAGLTGAAANPGVLAMPAAGSVRGAPWLCHGGGSPRAAHRPRHRGRPATRLPPTGPSCAHGAGYAKHQLPPRHPTHPGHTPGPPGSCKTARCTRTGARSRRCRRYTSCRVCSPQRCAARRGAARAPSCPLACPTLPHSPGPGRAAAPDGDRPPMPPPLPPPGTMARPSPRLPQVEAESSDAEAAGAAPSAVQGAYMWCAFRGRGPTPHAPLPRTRCSCAGSARLQRGTTAGRAAPQPAGLSYARRCTSLTCVSAGALWAAERPLSWTFLRAPCPPLSS